MKYYSITDVNVKIICLNSETVRVIPSVGIQIEGSKGGSVWLGRKRSKCFVPVDNIKTVVINETIIRVRPYSLPKITAFTRASLIGR